MYIQERILQYIEYKNITPYKFCKDLGFSMGYLDKRGAIGTDKYLKIIEYYPELSPEWLLTGKGEMLKAQEIKPSSAVLDMIKNSNVVKVAMDEVKRLESKSTLLEQLNENYKTEINNLKEQIKNLEKKLNSYEKEELKK